VDTKQPDRGTSGRDGNLSADEHHYAKGQAARPADRARKS